MRVFTDTELKGHALLFEGPLDLVRHARKANEPHGEDAYLPKLDVSYPGRRATNWNELERFFTVSWQEALARVQYVKDEVSKSHMPTPKSVKRKRYWSEDDGEVDVDRAMGGLSDLYLNFRRQKVNTPTNIALVTNLDKPRHVNPSGLFFRSTACIAATDLLEQLGYSVEVWMWCLGQDVFAKPNHWQFTACRMKALGDPVDEAAMVNTLSAWFTKYPVIGANAAPGVPLDEDGYGVGMEANSYPTSIDDCGIGEWKKYLDLEQGVLPVPVPMAWGNLDAAVECCAKTIQLVISLQGE